MKLAFKIFLALSLFFASTSIPCESKRLKGRIETVFVDGKIELPVELKANASKFDERLIEEKKKPRIIDARLKSFPTKLRGEWNGYLSLASFKTNPNKNVEIGEVERNLLKIGRKLKVRFRFYSPGNGIVTMAPPYAIFEKGPGVKRTFYKASFDPSTGKNIPPPHGGKWRSLDSKYDVSHKMLLNKVSMLGGERVEQDLLVRNSYIDRQTKGKKETFEENIYEFERVGSFNLRVKFAEITYDNKGEWLKTELYQGNVH